MSAQTPDINFTAVHIHQLVDKATREVYIAVSTDEITIGVTFPLDLDDRGIPLLNSMIDGFPHLIRRVFADRLESGQLIDLRPGCQEDLT